jgi:hypothetical protein
LGGAAVILQAGWCELRIERRGSRARQVSRLGKARTVVGLYDQIEPGAYKGASNARAGDARRVQGDNAAFILVEVPTPPLKKETPPPLPWGAEFPLIVLLLMFPTLVPFSLEEVKCRRPTQRYHYH